MEERFLHKKSLGQHFLNSPVVPRWLCEAGAVTSGDTVLEIGPGTGALTRALLAAGATVYAIETDDRAIAALRSTFATEITTGRLHIIAGDMRTFDLTSIVTQLPPYKVVANVPYYLSGFLLRVCLEILPPPTTLVFLLQKEVVERIARAKKSSLLSLSVAAYGEAKYIKTVSRGHFVPPPRVDSAILKVSNITSERVPPSLRDHFFTLLHLGLGQRRKQLRGCLRQVYDDVTVATAFATAGVMDTVRGEDLSLKTWLVLAQTLPPIPS